MLSLTLSTHSLQIDQGRSRPGIAERKHTRKAYLYHLKEVNPRLGSTVVAYSSTYLTEHTLYPCDFPCIQAISST